MRTRASIAAKRHANDLADLLGCVFNAANDARREGVPLKLIRCAAMRGMGLDPNRK